MIAGTTDCWNHFIAGIKRIAGIHNCRNFTEPIHIAGIRELLEFTIAGIASPTWRHGDQEKIN